MTTPIEAASEPTTRRQWLVALACYALFAVASYYPQSLRPWDSVQQIGDPLESAYLIAWNVHQLFRDPLHVFDANILWPARHALAFTDHRFLPSVLVAPVIWISGNPILAYNVAVMLALLFAGMAGRHLARVLGMGQVGAWTAGALYAFHTYQINEIPRLNVIFHAFIPLALAQMLKLLVRGERRAAWSVAGLLLLQGLSSNYLLLYAVLLMALVVLGSLLLQFRNTLARLRHLVLPGAIAGLVFLPIAIPYAQQTREHGLGRELPAGVTLDHYVQTHATNVLYGAIAQDLSPRDRPHFAGFLSVALALGALLFGLKGARQALLETRVWVAGAALLGAVFLVLSLGKDLIVFGERWAAGPYVLLYDFVPGFQLVRFPERLAFLAMLFLGLLVGRSVDLVRQSRWRAVGWLLAACVPLEHLSPKARGDERILIGDQVPAVYRWLATADVRCLAVVPARRSIRLDTVEMYYSTYHFKPMIHGYTAYPIPASESLRALALAFPSAESLDGLSAAGVDTVVAHLPAPAVLAELAALPPRKRKRFAKERSLRPFEFYAGIEEMRRAGRLTLVRVFDRPPQWAGQDEVLRLNSTVSP